MRLHTRFLLNVAFLTLVLSLVGWTAGAQYAGFSDPGSRQAATGGSGGLAAVESAVDGGAIPIGATAQVVVRFVNEGSQPVQTGLIRLYPSSTVSANVALNQCSEEPLPSGAECAVALSVKGLQAGSWRVEMLMSHSGRSRLVTATLSGSVESSGDSSNQLTSDIEVIPPELDFETLSDSQTLVEPVILRNITSTAVDIEDLYIDTNEQSGFSLKSDCKRLEAGQACIAVVSWSPKLRGRSSGVMVVRHSGPTALSSVSLTGEYNPSSSAEAEVFPQAIPGKGLLVSSLTELDFGTDIETASTITVPLVNAGDSALTIQNLRVSGTDNGLSIKEEGCFEGATLGPSDACPLILGWSPTRVGSLLDDVQIIHDGARGVLVLPVRGESIGTVSQDQKAIVLSGEAATTRTVIGGGNAEEFVPGTEPPGSEQAGLDPSQKPTKRQSYTTGVRNPASVLDGYKITSFAGDRAIVNGPGGSRLVFDSEEIVIGGLPWFVQVQKDGIEFWHQNYRVLLLFDRSLSSINRVSASSTSGSSVGSSTDSSDETDG